MVLSLSQILSFLPAAIMVTLAPGPDNLMILSIGLSKGQKQGIAFGAGCAIGSLNHTLLVSIGLSALIAASPTSLIILKFLGGLYLIWLGYQSLKSKGIDWKTSIQLADKEISMRAYFIKGLIANILNPKVILFFLAFLPRFIDVSKGYVGWQSAQLGLLFTFQTLIIFTAFGSFSGKIGKKLKQNPSASIWLDRMAGALFVVLGISLQFT